MTFTAPKLQGLGARLPLLLGPQEPQEPRARQELRARQEPQELRARQGPMEQRGQTVKQSLAVLAHQLAVQE